MKTRFIFFFTGTFLLSTVFAEAQLGAPAWSNRYLKVDHLNGFNAGPTDICFSPNGKINVTGYDQQTGDIQTIKIQPSGVLQYTVVNTNPNSTPFHFDSPVKILSDRVGNTYVLAKEYFSATFFPISGYRIVLIKYNGSLVEQWRVYGAPQHNGNDIPFDMTIDRSNNIIISGYFLSVNASFIRKISTTTGVALWTYNMPTDGAVYLTTDSSSNVYFTGKFNSAALGNEIYTGKLKASTGTAKWLRKYNYNTTVSANDVSTGIVVDSHANVYICGGGFKDSVRLEDALLLKYDSAGNLKFAKKWGSSFPSEGVYSIGIDHAGNIYTLNRTIRVGSIDFNDEWRDQIRKTDSSGNFLYNKFFNGFRDHPSPFAVFGLTKLVVSPLGSVYLSGYYWFGDNSHIDSDESAQSILINLNSNGDIISNNSGAFSGGEVSPWIPSHNHYFFPKDIALSATGDAFAVCLYTQRDSTHFDDDDNFIHTFDSSAWHVQKFIPGTLRLANEIPVTQSLDASVFPTVTSEHLTVLPDNDYTQIIITDISGRRVFETKVALTEGDIFDTDQSQLSPGIYILTLVGKNKISSHKFIRQ